MSIDRVYELLGRLADVIRAEERALGGSLGLQPVHLHALQFLARCNRYSDTPIAVAEYLGTTKGTASQTVALLGQKGLVRAQAATDDGRKVHLQLTAKGRRVVAQMRPLSAVAAGIDASGATTDDLERQLELLLLGIQRARGQRAFGVCRTCRHFRRIDGGNQCGLTGEPLSTDDAQRICREHASAHD